MKDLNIATRPANIIPMAVLLLAVTSCSADSTGLRTDTAQTDDYRLRIEILSDGLDHPWGMAFLPDGGILITERSGRLRLYSDGSLLPEAIGGVPRVAAVGQGGLLDVALHPDFRENRWVYLSYSAGQGGKVGTEVARGRLGDRRLEDLEVLFRMEPKSGGGRHFGSRLVFDGQGYLYISLGDRGDRPRAQRLDDHAGSLIRIHDDGRIPADNPFANDPTVAPGTYNYGHRNIQGAALRPGSGQLWTHEHGPQGGDELNIERPGVNYGWPVITYGANYGTGTRIGEGTHKPGMAQPIHYWVPSIAPSGMAFYDGDLFPDWRGDLFVGSLKFDLLVRLELEDDRVVAEERMLEGVLGRIRDVRSGPDGHIYLLSDESNGVLARLSPAGS